MTFLSFRFSPPNAASMIALIDEVRLNSIFSSSGHSELYRSSINEHMTEKIIRPIISINKLLNFELMKTITQFRHRPNLSTFDQGSTTNKGANKTITILKIALELNTDKSDRTE